MSDEEPVRVEIPVPAVLLEVMPLADVESLLKQTVADALKAKADEAMDEFMHGSVIEGVEPKGILNPESGA